MRASTLSERALPVALALAISTPASMATVILKNTIPPGIDATNPNPNLGTVDCDVTTTAPGGGSGGTTNFLNCRKAISGLDSQGNFNLLIRLIDNGEGATTYLLSESIVNNTNEVWDDYSIGIGCGVHGEILCGLGIQEPLTFVLPPAGSPGGPPGTLDVVSPTYLHWIGMGVNPGSSFSISAEIVTCASCTRDPWQIHQSYSVLPEPESAAVVGLALFGMAVSRWRRQSKIQMKANSALL